MKRFVDVCVDLPVDGFFTYSVPDDLGSVLSQGKRVLVPFGRRTVTAYAVSFPQETALKDIKPIIKVLDEEPVIDASRMKFLEWAASYCVVPPAEFFKLTHPSFTNVKSRNVLRLTKAGQSALSGDVVASETTLNALRLLGSGKSRTALKKKKDAAAEGYASVENLIKQGLIEEVSENTGGGIEKKVLYARLIKAPGEELLKKAPLRRKLVDYLLGVKEASMAELRGALRGADAALKKLRSDGFVVVEERVIEPDALSEVKAKDSSHVPNAGQATAIEAIGKGMKSGRYAPFLLHGITGSGKTFVYLKAMEQALSLGKSALMLVPEISLTSRAASFLKGLFPGRVAVLHSALNDGEKYAEWRKILEGRVDVVVGARSALFSPVKNLGLIIVDEEHDSSYKQSEGVRYNARDLSLMLGKMLDATVVLGSATPSIESYYNAREGRFKLLTLGQRIDNAVLPEIELCDMRKETKGAVLSLRLQQLMKEAFDRGEQTLLFLNRRGFSVFVQCRGCGQTPECLNCSVTLTMHKGSARLKCHYCDFSAPVPESCPSCGSFDIMARGMGTEKVEEEVRALLPKARVARMDRDTVGKKGAMRRIIEAVEGGEVDVLVGTQMVSKGHHFPKITLVGVISADTSLNIPDYRSAEQTYQLIAQASGRAGREGGLSRVVVQTLNPAHPCLLSAAVNDYEGFFANEFEERELAGYPPVKRLALVRIEGAKPQAVEAAANALSKISRAAGRQTIECLGPVPALVEKVRGKLRRQMLFKANDAKTMNAFLFVLKRKISAAMEFKSVSVVFDVDPYSTV